MMLEKRMTDELLGRLMLLKNDVWNLMAKNMEILLVEYGDSVKFEYLSNAMNIVNVLISYNVCTPYIIEMLANMLCFYESSTETH